MPEGDTIFRTATRLRPFLVGRTIEAARARDPLFPAGTLVGRAFLAVEARGKHLLMHLDDGRTIHSHLGMHGSWHWYPPGEPWQKDRRLAALVVEVPGSVCVCFSPKVLQLLSADQLRRHPHLSHLGPDLLAEQVDDAEVLRRFRVHDRTPIGEAVMNQSIVCRDRQCVQVRGPVPDADEPLDDGRPVVGRTGVEHRANRPAVAGEEPERLSAPHAVCTRRAKTLGLWPERPTLLRLWPADPAAETRRLGTHHVLVSRLPGSLSLHTGVIRDESHL